MSLGDLLPWRTRPARHPATVLALFRGSLPPAQGEFDHLAAAGVEAVPTAATGGRWALELRHPRWGRARMESVRDLPPPPPPLVNLQVGLTPAERETLCLACSALPVVLLDPPADVLLARKRLLLFVHAVLGDDGLGAYDLQSQLLWSAAALADETAHDAPLDVGSLHVIHCVQDDDEPAWIHTHGLEYLGISDLDLVGVHPENQLHLGDLLRALVCAQLDGALKPGGAAMKLMNPGGPLRLVPAATYDRRCATAHRRGGEPGDDEHRGAVLCEARNSWFGFGAIRPAQPMQTPLPDHLTLAFPKSATQLMEERSRGTWPLFCRLHAELAPLGITALVKLGKPCDGDPTDREHIWFEVHTTDARGVEATCLNQPFQVATLRQGQRGRHTVDELTEWRLMTPVGQITPWQQTAARFLREAMAKHPGMRAELEAAARGEASPDESGDAGSAPAAPSGGASLRKALKRG